MFKRYKNTDLYKSIEKDIVDIVGSEDYEKYKKVKRREKIVSYAIAAGTVLTFCAVVYKVQEKVIRATLENYVEER